MTAAAITVAVRARFPLQSAALTSVLAALPGLALVPEDSQPPPSVLGWWPALVAPRAPQRPGPAHHPAGLGRAGSTAGRLQPLFARRAPRCAERGHPTTGAGRSLPEPLDRPRSARAAPPGWGRAPGRAPCPQRSG